MEKRSKSNQSVEKTFQIIETMAEARRPIRLQDISQQTKLPASTVLRMINTLVDLGYAFQEQETLRYGLTLQFARIGSLAGSGIGLRDYAHPVMEKLSTACGEACCLAIEQNEEVVYIDLVDGPDNMLRIMQHIGKRAPMHCTGIGKLLLYAAVELFLRFGSLCADLAGLYRETRPPAIHRAHLDHSGVPETGAGPGPAAGLGHGQRGVRNRRPVCGRRHL